MHRVIFELGPFTVYSYGLLVAAGFLVSSVLILADAEKHGFSREGVFDCLIAILIGGIVGGRLLFAAINHEYYFQHPVRIFFLTEGGMAFHGSLAGAITGGAIVAKIKGLPFLGTADLISPYIALGHSIGRIGCFLNGCCYGKIIHGGIGVTFPGDVAMRVPTQIYSSVLLLLLFLVLLALGRRKKFDGYVFCSYIMLYSALRFLIEFLRGDNPSILAGMTLAQFISIATFFAGFAWFKILERRSFRTFMG